jgi:hypothetical protein
MDPDMTITADPTKYIYFTPPPDEVPFAFSKAKQMLSNIDPTATRNVLVSLAMTGRALPDGSKLKLRVCKTHSGNGTTREEYRRFVTDLAAAWENA